MRGSEVITTERCPFIYLIGQAFLAVRLVTRSAALAEEAVLEAIDCEPPIAGDARRFALKAIELALRMPRAGQINGEDNEGNEDSLLDLPPELAQVSQMPAELRHCFVLRVLVGASPQLCVSILGQQIDEIDECVCRAMIHIAGERISGIESTKRAGLTPA